MHYLAELSKENEGLKSTAQEATDGGRKSADKDGGSNALMEELMVVRSERDRAVNEEKKLRQSLTLLRQEKEVCFKFKVWLDKVALWLFFSYVCRK